MPAAQIPVVRPDRPMSLVDVDVRLRRCALALRHYRVSEAAGEEGSGVFVERVLMDADRLLDVRLAIVRGGS